MSKIPTNSVENVPAALAALFAVRPLSSELVDWVAPLTAPLTRIFNSTELVLQAVPARPWRVSPMLQPDALPESSLLVLVVRSDPVVAPLL